MDASGSNINGSRPSRIEFRLKNAIQEKKFYEAHQIYKTLAFRAINKKNFQEAIDVLVDGSNFLLTNKEYQSGTDLACMIVSTFDKHKQPFSKTNLPVICTLLSKMKQSSDERTNFICKVLDLLEQNPDLKNQFNEYLARKYWQEQAFSECRRCALLSNNGYLIGRFLVDFQQKYGLDSEIDLFPVQTVLQLLCLKKPNVAEIAFYLYSRTHPRLEPGPPFIKYPLLNFLWLLLLSIRNRYKGSVFTVLREKYGSHLKRDPDFSFFLDKIASIYFGFRPANGGNPNLLGNLMNMISGEGLGDIFGLGDTDAFDSSAEASFAYDDVE